MEIEFNIDVDDATSYTPYYVDNSPDVKKYVNRTRAFYILIGALFLLIGLSWFLNNNIALSFVSTAVGIYLVIVGIQVKHTYKKGSIKRAKELYNSGANGFVGEHVFIITPEYFKDVTASYEAKSNWDIIEKIVSTDDFIFIIRRPALSAFIIPKKSFATDAAFNQFFETAKQYHQSAIKSSIQTPQ